MKKSLMIIVSLLFVVLLSGCGNKYEGYWCRYTETATIVILLEDDMSEAQNEELIKTITSYDNLQAYTYYDKTVFDESGEDIYNSYFVSFNSTDGVTTYIEQLVKLPGVLDVTQNSAKTDFELYHLDKKNKYTFSNSDEALEEDIIKGKYKIKKGVITFTPNDSDNTSMLYIKDDHLCGDSQCTVIYAKSNETCSSDID